MIRMRLAVVVARRMHQPLKILQAIWVCSLAQMMPRIVRLAQIVFIAATGVLPRIRTIQRHRLCSNFFSRVVALNT